MSVCVNKPTNLLVLSIVSILEILLLKSAFSCSERILSSLSILLISIVLVLEITF